MSDTTEDDLYSDPDLEDLPGEEAEEGHEEGVDGDEGQGAEGREEDAQGDDARAQGQEGRRVSQPGRAERRVQEALRKAKEAEERAAALERQLSVRPRPAEPTAAQLAEQQRQEDERLSLMDPIQASRYLLDKQGRQFADQIAALRRETADSADRAAYQAMQASQPLAKKYAEDVERVVAEQAANGYQVKRSEALKWVIGNAFLNKASSETKKQKAAGAARVAGQTVSGRGAGGDTAPEPRGRRNDDSLEALERRLKGKFI
jgi:hypothetical protein